jgi:TatA/E family protein of Tat protein translocase
MPSIGPMELVIVLAIALLVLGPKRLPEAGRGLGRGLRVQGGDHAPPRPRRARGALGRDRRLTPPPSRRT